MQADGEYYVGDFDGSKFIPRQPQQNAYGTWRPYAAQTYNEPKDRVIHMAFLRAKCKNCTYTNMMSLPRELSLTVADGIYHLRMKPVKEYFAARHVTDNRNYSFSQNKAMEVEILLGAADFVKLHIGEITIQYDKTSGILYCDNEKVWLGKNHTELHVLIDKGMLEISSETYIRPVWFGVDEQRQQGKISAINTETLESITIYEI